MTMKAPKDKNTMRQIIAIGCRCSIQSRRIQSVPAAQSIEKMQPARTSSQRSFCIPTTWPRRSRASSHGTEINHA